MPALSSPHRWTSTSLLPSGVKSLLPALHPREFFLSVIISQSLWETPTPLPSLPPSFLHTNVHSSVIHNSQNVEATGMPTSGEAG